jgi:hypothetical protein
MAKKKDIYEQTEPSEYVSEASDKTVKYFNRLFERAYAFDSARYDDYTELIAFYELCQSELPQYQVEKPWIHNINAPYATDAINLRIASLQANDYLGEIEPLSPDDVEIVQKLNWAYHALWNEMDMDAHVNESILRAAVMREAYTHVVYEDKPVGGTNRRRQGKLDSYFVDSASVHIDPKARALKDADFVIVTDRITPKRVKSRYPDFDFEKSKQTSYSPKERGEIYAGTDYNTEQEYILTKFTYYEKEEDGIYKTVLVENQIVEDTTKMPINVYPIAQLRWQNKLKSPYGVGLLDMILPLQKTVNEVESAVANAALQFSSPSYVLSAGSGINPEDLALMGGTPGAVFIVDDGVNINEVIAPLMRDRKIDQEMITVKQENERAIYKLAGISDAFMGSLGTAGNTAGGAADSINRSKVIENRFFTNLENYIEDLTEIVVEYITRVFGGETMYVRGDKNSDNSFNFDEMQIPENAEDIEYTFYIKMDIKTKYSKQLEKQLIKELYEAQIQYDAPVKALTFLDVLKTYDVPNIQELVERMEHMANMDAQQRAELAIMLVTAAAELGVDEAMLKQAVAEIIQALPETPTVDQIMMMLEQKKQQEELAAQQAQQALGSAELNQMQQAQQAQQAQQMPQEPTGDEVYEAPEPTGDEVYGE